MTAAFYDAIKLSFKIIKTKSVDSAINTSTKTPSYPSASKTAQKTSMACNKEEDQQKKEERQIIIIMLKARTLKKPSSTLKNTRRRRSLQ